MQEREERGPLFAAFSCFVAWPLLRNKRQHTTDGKGLIMAKELPNLRNCDMYHTLSKLTSFTKGGRSGKYAKKSK